MVRTRLVQVGNSQGIRIPKALLQQIGLKDEVFLEARADALLIRAVRPARFGWDEQFAAAKLTEGDAEEEAELMEFTNASLVTNETDLEW